MATRPIWHEKWTLQVLLPFAAVNVAMIVLALWLMRLGCGKTARWPFAAGVLYFLLWALLRYVDLFAGVGGMLGAALMFLLCGVGLFVVARFWLHRKEIDSPLPLGEGLGVRAARMVQNTVIPQDALTLTLSQRERGLRPALLSARFWAAIDRAGRHDCRPDDLALDGRDRAVEGCAGRSPRHVPRRLRHAQLRLQPRAVQGIPGLPSASRSLDLWR